MTTTPTSTPTRTAATRFLENRRIAVTGVSRTPSGHGSNVVFARLKERGYEAFAVNPHADEIEGGPCYPDLASIPGGVTAVVIGTRPEHADTTMREAVDLGITQVWMHRSFGTGSVSATATDYGRAHGVTVIDGGCPLMYGPTSDGGHRFMCRLMTLTGKVPRRV
jgi:uncharacterized protein